MTTKPKISISDNGQVLYMKTVHPCGTIEHEVCAIGRSTEWPPVQDGWADVRMAAGEARDKERSGITYFDLAVGLAKAQFPSKLPEAAE